MSEAMFPSCSFYPTSSRRTEALATAAALLAEGKAALAREHYVKAVDVTPQMAYQLIKVRD